MIFVGPFLMGSLELSKQMGDRINGLLANYVKGNDRIIAKERWGIARELGGYGLIDTHTLYIHKSERL